MRNEMMNEGMMCPMCHMSGGSAMFFFSSVLFIAIIAVLICLCVYLIRKSKA